EQELDGLAFIEREQKFLRDRVVAIILFQDLQSASSRVTQDDRVGLEMRRHANERGAIDAGFQVERKTLAGNKKVGVVNGERRGLTVRVRLLLPPRERAQKQQ